MIDPANILGVVLAGGQSRRMSGTDKAFVTLGQETMLDRSVQALSRQVEKIIINANGDTKAHGGLGLPVIADRLQGFRGPLAGVHAAMRYTEGAFTHIATVATDTPFFPADLVTRLAAAAGDGATIAMAQSGGHRHPVFALWPVALADDLEAWLVAGENPKIMAWVHRHPHQMVDFPFTGGHDPFFNVNTPGDLEIARQRASEMTATP